MNEGPSGRLNTTYASGGSRGDGHAGLGAGNLGIAEQRWESLGADISALEQIERQLGLYREDLERDFRFRKADVENVLLDFEKRGGAYFDETLRLGRVFDLMNRARIQADFEREVIGDLSAVVERRAGEIVDWMVGADLRLWQAVTEAWAGRTAGTRA